LEGALGQQKGWLEFLARQQRYVEFWVHGFSNRGVKSLLLSTVTEELNSRANIYLSHLSGGRATVNFQTQTVLASGELREKFRVAVSYAHGAGDYEGISGGEMRRVDIAVLFALGDLAAARSVAPVHLRLLDEPFDNLDNIGKEAVVDLLRSELLPRIGTLLVMSHDEDLKSYFNKRIVVVKEKGVSRIETDVNSVFTTLPEET